MTTTTQDLTERAQAALKLARSAQRRAKKTAADEAVNRTTRRHQALRIKADALDEVEQVLGGKA